MLCMRVESKQILCGNQAPDNRPRPSLPHTSPKQLERVIQPDSFLDALGQAVTREVIDRLSFASRLQKTLACDGLCV